MAILDFRLKIEERRRAQGDLGHLPSASLGQYALLSFVVIGRGQSLKSKERRKGFFCGSGFPRPELVEGQPRSCDFSDLNDFNDFSGLDDLLFTADT